MLEYLVLAANLAAVMSSSWKGGVQRRLLLSKLESLGLSTEAAQLLAAGPADLTAKRFARLSRLAANGASWIALIKNFREWSAPDPEATFAILAEIEESGLRWPPTAPDDDLYPSDLPHPTDLN